MIYQHEAREADQAVMKAIDSHLGLRGGAGDENRTRTISLGI
jgi:hypothetical protein